MVAFKQSDHVISISLTITPSLLEKLSTIERAFPELQDLVLLSRYGELLTMPSAFRWSQRLRRLHLTGIAFPVLLRPQYLSSSTNIIDFRLHDAFLPWNLSLVMLKNLLSGMTGLRSLSLHSNYTYYHLPLPPHGERIVLPVLTRLDYLGSVAYLEGIVTMIDAPSLEEIEITSDNPSLTLSKFKNFIDRIEMHRSHHGAHILSSEPTISIPLSQLGVPMCLKLKSICQPLHMQISSMAQIWLNFSSFHFNDKEDLRISRTRPSIRMDSSHKRDILELLNKGKKLFHFNMNRLMNVVHTLQALETQRRHENMFPGVHKLYIPQPGPHHAVLREVAVSFMVSRQLSGHPIEVEYERPCDINEQHGSRGTVYDQCKDR